MRILQIIPSVTRFIVKAIMIGAVVAARTAAGDASGARGSISSGDDNSQLGFCVTATLNGPVPCGTPVALAEMFRTNSDGSTTSVSGTRTSRVEGDATQVRICQTLTTYTRDKKTNAITNTDNLEQCGNYPKTMFLKKKGPHAQLASEIIYPDPADITSFGTNGTEIMQARAAQNRPR
jgi:hypothetical protein